jgi:hypothetical protein
LISNDGWTWNRGASRPGGGTTGFCARFLDKDDAPVKNFTVNLRGTDK